MKKLQTVPHFSDDSLQAIMNSQTEIRAFRDWQIIYSVQTNPGKKSDDIANVLGVKRSKVLKTIQLYNKLGQDWRTYGKWGGRRETRCHLSLEDEKLLLKSLEDAALSGKILTFKHIMEEVERVVGKKVSDDYIWDLFSRHGWKKKVTRPHHPKADKNAQEEFKKNSIRIWQPSR